jgi:ribokinase
VPAVAGVPSGVAPITVQPDGHDPVLIVPGANDTLGPDDAVAALDDLGAPGVVLCQLEVPDAAVAAAFAWARDHGALTMLNPAPARPVAEAPLDLTAWALLLARGLPLAEAAAAACRVAALSVQGPGTQTSFSDAAAAAAAGVVVPLAA